MRIPSVCGEVGVELVYTPCVNFRFHVRSMAQAVSRRLFIRFQVRSMAQAVSRRRSPRRPGFDPGSIRVGFVEDKV